MIEIGDYLKRFRSETVLLRPNRGNAGDAIIAHATIGLLRECGVAYRLIDDFEDVDGQVVLYGGGGNLVELYEDAAEVVGRYHHRARHFVLLPHTIRGHRPLLEELGQNVDLICREPMSLEYLSSIDTGANVMLCHDLALSLDGPQILAGRRRDVERNASSRPYRRWLRRYRRRALRRRLEVNAKHWRSPRDPRVLNAFRLDPEASGLEIPRDNFDLSKRIPSDARMTSEACIERTTQEMFRFLDGYDVVNTNRLHVCITSALLDKQVFFFPNKYWKNEAIYHFSLAERFPSIRWMGARD